MFYIKKLALKSHKVSLSCQGPSLLALLIKKKGCNMKKSYAKSLKEYDQNFEIDAKKILAAMKRFKESPKKPTSVALDETTIQELKALAEIQGI